VLYLRLIILLLVVDIPVDNVSFLVIDSVNLKIKPTQSFVCAHRDIVCVYMFIEMITDSYVYEYVCMCVSTVFQKKQKGVEGIFSPIFFPAGLILGHLVINSHKLPVLVLYDDYHPVHVGPSR
jgi:hypothetical protein